MRRFREFASILLEHAPIKEKDSDAQVAVMKDKLDRGLTLFNKAGTKLEKIAADEYEATTKTGKTTKKVSLRFFALTKGGKVQTWYA